MRTNYKVKSLHYYHYDTVPDRIDVSECQKDRLPSCIPSPDSVAKSLLLTLCDDTVLLNNLNILFIPVLVKTLPFFKVAFLDLNMTTIHHKRHSEMSQKSVVVSLINDNL